MSELEDSLRKKTVINNISYRRGVDTAVFIDGYNFNKACSLINVIPDFAKIQSFFREHVNLTRIHFFVVNKIIDDNSSGEGREQQSYNKMVKLLDFLKHNGFSIFSKNIRENSEQTQHGSAYPKIDIEIICKIFQVVSIEKSVKNVIIFSGNGDLSVPVETLKSIGINTTIISLKRSNDKTNSNFTSKRLSKTCDSFIPLDDFLYAADAIKGKEPTEYIYTNPNTDNEDNEEDTDEAA